MNGSCSAAGDGISYDCPHTGAGERDPIIELSRLCHGQKDGFERTCLNVSGFSKRCCLGKSSTAKSRFWAAVSHDVRTPANSICLISEVLGRFSSDPGFSNRIPGLAGDLQNNAKALVELVSDVLEMVRIESGDFEANEKDTALDSFLSEEVESLRAVVEAKGRSLEYIAPETDVVVQCDKLRFGRVLSNVLGNSLRYTGEGKITVSVKPAKDGSVTVQVVDSGCRLTEEQLSSLLDEFLSPGVTNGGQNGGAGLKLFIAKQMAEGLGCRLQVGCGSEEGVTSVIVVPPEKVRLLPLVETARVGGMRSGELLSENSRSQYKMAESKKL